MPAWTGSSVVPLTLDGGSHGKEKESQKSSEEKEEEESSKKESKEEVGKEIREEKSGQEEVCQEEEGGKTQKKVGQESCGETGSANGGNGGSSAFHGGNARGKNCPEPRSSLALSNGFKALSGLRMGCGQLEGSSLGLNRRHSGMTDKTYPGFSAVRLE